MSVPFVALEILVLTRFGLLGFVSMTLVSFVVSEFPLTFDPTLWWAPRGFVGLGAVVVLGAYGFWTSLAGKSALGGDWLET
jgi:hypothetical protein